MASIYARRPASGFGKPDKAAGSGKNRVKPLKRPLQARAKFTVQAIYDAFVRIWRRHGWEGVTTRAVALETGISVGTLYEYFPNKHALLSGYFRHYLDALLQAVDQQVVQAMQLTWEERIQRLVRLTCGMDVEELPYFDSAMLMLEYQIAEPKHHRRACDELSARWIATFDACTDLPHRPDADTIKALFVSVLGGRRYLLLVGPDDAEIGNWVGEMQRLCCTALHNADTD
ncbi:TetR/AcrR family transcriptional regulator [Noviherbaspirillum cavernae]|uniref:TetR/AcrR family transcriptional regulator n=1 Tax=Noviherbaspirillum cavernae TaxID=2320862 RepID=A0A418X3N8_9BURK|nr:TetR/AcrR family transcriptional regulator [Noviherbaspirillum cavernae]RJG07035.1 TetR/AcrR family transcriptional regulator [Noviherbaspirillum cavernae]